MSPAFELVSCPCCTSPGDPSCPSCHGWGVVPDLLPVAIDVPPWPEGQEPDPGHRAVVLARLTDGIRWLQRHDDPDLLAWFLRPMAGLTVPGPAAPKWDRMWTLTRQLSSARRQLNPHRSWWWGLRRWRSALA